MQPKIYMYIHEYNMNMRDSADVTFCFLVTRDLSKEHIWREWFEGLNRLQIKCAIVVHCSHKGSIQSEWFAPFAINPQMNSCSCEKLHPRFRTMSCEALQHI